MPREKKGNLLLSLIVLCSLCVVIVALIFHQLVLLFSLTFTLWSILIFLWGVPLIFAGGKEVLAARKHGEKVPWQSNRYLVRGLTYIFPWVIMYIASSGFISENLLRDKNGMFFEIIEYVVAFIVIFPLLILLIIFFIATIRYILTTPHPYAKYIQDAFTEE
ncbi:hypothetical protein KDH_62920 [Dictyobacter sp. S3.2.2.5]|uniref:DUF4328 domain-containing protein n=1 Tax=Dictyobacter halimunensis TaxID=3026934 RepID=A0ABQ6G3T2_9CHLR|nr:hypothetical protein KDH_62920 [Dictyobacter sp. S3.2.2.5]